MSPRRIIGIVVALGMTALALTACGGSSSSSGSSEASTSGSTTEATKESGSGEAVTVDVGSSQIELEPGEKPKVAVIPAGTIVQYNKSWLSGMESAMKEHGFEYEVFDPNFEATQQENMVKNVIQRGEFNAIMTEPLSEQLCAPLSKEAPAAGIVVTIHDLPLCERSEAEFGEEIWAPGTLAYIGAQSSKTYIEASADAAIKSLKGPQDVAAVLGPPLAANTVISKKVVEDYADNTNGVELAGIVNTDFTTTDALAKTADLLQANPNLTAIFSPASSDVTLGIATAIEQAGRTGEVVIVQDLGAAKSVLPLVEKGILLNTYAYYPKLGAEEGVKAIAEAFEGKKVERAIPALAEGTPEEPYEVNKENVKEFEPEF